MMILHSSIMHGKGNKPQIIKLTRDKNTVQQNNSKQCNFPNLCPYHLLRCYIEVRKSFKSTDEQFFVFKDHSPVTPKAMWKVFKDCISDIGLNSNSYVFHGFRAGRACDLLEMGVSVETIKKLGRWRSNAVYVYLR